METLKTKISINDLRTDKGGDPDKYREALLSLHSPSNGELAPSSCGIQSCEGRDTADAPLTPPTDATKAALSSSPIHHIDDALAFESKRRAAVTQLDNLRSKSSSLQKEVIAVKKKAGEDCSQEVSQLKEWKIEISNLAKEVKEAEKLRDGELDEINLLLQTAAQNEKVVGENGVPERNHFKSKMTTKVDGTQSVSEKSLEKGGENNSVTTFVPLSSPSNDPSSRPTDRQHSKTPQDANSPNNLPLLPPEHIKSIPPERILNLNVGVLGHVDTGKTSLVKTLSSVLSTAALDKSKQSRARGITLDLGFSAFLLPLPPHLMEAGVGANGGSGEAVLKQKYDLLQVTLVDCPGHASLIRTIIGGAQIIDMVLLVVDATKGMQTQTAECLVIAEMTTRNLIVVLNKIDLFPQQEREERLRLAEKKMRTALRGTKFEDAQMVGISACVGGEKVAAATGESISEKTFNSTVTNGNNGNGNNAHVNMTTQNISGLLNILQSQMRPPSRDAQPSPTRFHFAVDHCFPIKGQGTVLTGTCLSGSARPNDMVEFPTLSTQKKIKGLQMFRRKANVIQQGDRAGICVSNFDAKLMERGIIASPGTVKLIRGAIAVVRKVRFFKGGLQSGAKFHVSVGHTTVMATVYFWGAREIAEQIKNEEETLVRRQNQAQNKQSQQQKHKNPQNLGKSSLGGSADLAGLPRLKFNWDQDFLHQDNYIDVLPLSTTTTTSSSSSKTATHTQLQYSSPNSASAHSAPASSNSFKSSAGSDTRGVGRRKNSKSNPSSLPVPPSQSLPPLHWARLEFLTPVYCPMDSLVIGSRLDAEVSANACRLAFSGRLVERYDSRTDHGRIKTYTTKEKVGTVCRLGDPHRRNDDNKLVRYEVIGTDLFKKETNMTQFVGLFIETDRGTSAEDKNKKEVGVIQSSFGTSGKFRVHFPGGTEVKEGDSLYLRFKRYANDPKKGIHQDDTVPVARPGVRVDLPVKAKKKKNAKNGIREGGGGGGSNAAVSSTALNESKNETQSSSSHDSNVKDRAKTTFSSTETTTSVFGEIITIKGEKLTSSQNNEDKKNSNGTVVIISGLFSMKDDIRQHKGRKVINISRNNEEGTIDGSFGKVGKCKVSFKDGVLVHIGDRIQMLPR